MWYCSNSSGGNLKYVKSAISNQRIFSLIVEGLFVISRMFLRSQKKKIECFNSAMPLLKIYPCVKMKIFIVVLFIRVNV